MRSKSKKKLPNPWQFPVETITNSNPIYICISGNSGVGKSTLVGAIGNAIMVINPNTVIVDEKSLHHLLLPYLFHEPKKFAYEMQLNFMIQRNLLVKHWLNNGYNLVMERSHLEDVIFIKHLLSENLVTKEEYIAYMSVWNSLSVRLPLPNWMLYIDIPPELSIQRITQAEESGERPREFPDEKSKKDWVRSWHNFYVERMTEIREQYSNRMNIMFLDGNLDIDSIVKKIMISVANDLG